MGRKPFGYQFGTFGVALDPKVALSQGELSTPPCLDS